MLELPYVFIGQNSVNSSGALKKETHPLEGAKAVKRDIHNGTKQDSQPKTAAETPSDRATQSTGNQRESSPPSEIEKARSESTLFLEDIKNEVEETLIEIERLKSKVGSATQSPPLLDANLKPPAEASAPQSGVAPNAASSAIASADEQWSERLDMFRAQLTAPKPTNRRKNIILLIAAVVFLAILGVYYFLRSSRVAGGPRPVAPVAPAGEPKTASRIVIPMQAITKVSPTYPLQARTKKITGRVELEAEINWKGDVVRATAISGPAQLRRAAEEALMQWKFRPSSINGINTASRARISMDFNIKGNSGVVTIVP